MAELAPKNDSFALAGVGVVGVPEAIHANSTEVRGISDLIIIPRTTAQLAGAPVPGDTALGGGAIFVDTLNPTLLYRINTAATGYASFGGGGASAFAAITGQPTDNANLATSFANLLGGTLTKPGARYKILAGVLRNFDDGNGWVPLTNTTSSGHEALNIETCTTSSTQITVNYPSIGATEVVGMICAPDDGLARLGITVGASVGLTGMGISLARPTSMVSDYISYNGSAFVSNNSVFTIGTYTSGVLSLTHLGVPTADYGSQYYLTPRGVSTLQPVAGSAGASSSTITWKDTTTGTVVTTPSTNMQAYLSRGRAAGAVDPTTISQTTFPSVNIWIFGIFRTN